MAKWGVDNGIKIRSQLSSQIQLLHLHLLNCIMHANVASINDIVTQNVRRFLRIKQ